MDHLFWPAVVVAILAILPIGLIYSACGISWILENHRQKKKEKRMSGRMSLAERTLAIRHVIENLDRFRHNLIHCPQHADELMARTDAAYLAELLDPEIDCPVRGRPKQQPPAPVVQVVYKEVIRQIERQPEYDELPAPQQRPRLTLRMPSRQEEQR